MKNIIENLLKDFEPRHSDFQIENFIVMKAGDQWAQYKQCLREIAGRRDALLNLEEKLKIFGSQRAFDLIAGLIRGKEFRQIRAARRERKRTQLVKDIHSCKRELSKLIELALTLRDKIGAIDEERKRELEAQSWFDKARRMAAIDLYLAGNLSHQTMEFILSMPIHHKRQIFIGLSAIKRENLLSFLIE